MKSEISRKDWEKYILGLFFGKNEPLLNCINRAYRDFSRTLHEYSTVGKKLHWKLKIYY